MPVIDDEEMAGKKVHRSRAVEGDIAHEGQTMEDSLVPEGQVMEEVARDDDGQMMEDVAHDEDGLTAEEVANGESFVCLAERQTATIRGDIRNFHEQVSSQLHETNDVLLNKNVNQAHMLKILNAQIRKLTKEKEELQVDLNLKNDMLISGGYSQDAVIKKEYTKGRVVSRVMHIESTTSESLEDTKAMKMRMDAIEARMSALEARVGSVDARVGSVDAKLDTVITMLQSSSRSAP